jgi:hypothetical protein
MIVWQHRAARGLQAHAPDPGKKFVVQFRKTTIYIVKYYDGNTLSVRIRRKAVVTRCRATSVPKTSRAVHLGGWRGFLCDTLEMRMSTVQ